jgi:hypothetical protein
MTFRLTKASDGWDPPTRELIEINSIEDLKSLAEQYGYSLIVDFFTADGLPEITIYDDYIE